MTRSQLITKVANDTGISAVEVEKIMDGIFGTIGDVLKAGDKVTIAALAALKCANARPRTSPTPRPRLPAAGTTAIPGFKASGRLKEKVGK